MVRSLALFRSTKVTHAPDAPATGGALEIVEPVDAALEEIVEVADAEPIEEPAEANVEPVADEIADELADELETTLKHLGSQMAALSANFEEVRRARDQLEKKVDNVEQRLVSLGSLAEAVSIQYNPFLSDERPEGAAWSPRPGANGGAPQPAPAPPTAPSAPFAIAPAIEHAPVPRAMLQLPALTAPDVRAVENHLLHLEWVGVMLDRVGRAGFLDLLDYYEGLGWLKAETKERTTRLAVGINAPERVGDGGWVRDLDLHRRSLVVLQTLEGNAIPVDRRERLRLDVRRLVDG